MNYEALVTLRDVKLKGLTNENVDERLLSTALLRAQDIDLTDQIGRAFLRDLQVRKSTNSLTIPEQEMIHDYILPYLAICVDIRAIDATSNRINNAGTGRVNATEFQNNGNEDSRLFRNALKGDRDVLARDLRSFLGENRIDFPLFTNFSECHKESGGGDSFINSIFTI